MNQQLINFLFSAKERSTKMTFNEAIELMWEKNLLQTGEIAERGLVKKSKGRLKQNSRNKKSSDFNDGSELKYVTARQDTANCVRANIVGLKGKTGLLRVVVFEPITKKNYFFRVPHKIYSTVASPKVYFNAKGNPRTPTRKGSSFDMWEHVCTVNEWSAK
jgi:hypothetical protein